MIKQTVEEWREEGQRRFGPGLEWKFVCPRCGNVASGKDFAEKAGIVGSDAANTAVQSCIGRHVEGEGCNWAAFGLFGTMGKGRTVVIDGREVEVFDFAQEEAAADA